MADIQKAMEQSSGERLINLGAGNPVAIEGMNKLWGACLQTLSEDTEQLMESIGRYSQTRGLPVLLDAICEYFSEKYTINITRDNVVITPGSQALYFYAANLFTGHKGNDSRHLLLPNIPDYTGYGGVGMSSTPIIGCMPKINRQSTHQFRYEMDISDLSEGSRKSTGAAFLSSPCNPTGRVVSEAETTALSKMLPDAPIFVDNAYGNPFPSVCFKDSQPLFIPGLVNTFSLSKVGFPGERVGFAVGSEDVIDSLCAMQSNACIHGAMLGQALAALAIDKNDLHSASVELIRTHYQGMHDFAQQLFDEYFEGLDYCLHQAEGGMFKWLWMPSLHVGSMYVYEAAKDKGVFIVPGDVFFSGISEQYPHVKQCFRISLTCSPEDLEVGVRTLSRIFRELADQE